MEEDDKGASGTIMVVDDTPANLHLLEVMLTQAGYRPLLFPSAELALRAALRRVPDLILLDVMMPDMDGYTFCQRLQADPTLRDVPVLFISALHDTASKVRAFESGGVDYLTKPFHEAEVLARVRTQLRLREMHVALKARNDTLAELVDAKVREISSSQLATIVAMSKIAEYRDDETGAHIERTRTFCKVLAEAVAARSPYADVVDPAFIENLYNASVLHDIGKVGISDAILFKPGKLSPAEFEAMKEHTLIGARTLESVRAQYPGNGFITMGIEVTRSHHERWDGSGYPDGLSGEAIPLAARIMAIADVYDALRSRRPYKEPFTHERSVAIIQEGRGGHFDPALVDAFNPIADRFAVISDALRDRSAASR